MPMYVAPAHFIAGWLMSANLGVSFNPITQIGSLWLMYFFAPFSFIYFLYSRKKKNSSEQPLKRQTATSVTKSMNTEPDIEFYEQALAELDSGGRDTGIWAKAYAEADNEESSRKLYVKLRATDLMKEQGIGAAREIIVESLKSKKLTQEEELNALGLQNKKKINDKRDLPLTVSLIFFLLFVVFVFWQGNSDDNLSRPIGKGLEGYCSDGRYPAFCARMNDFIEN